MMTTTASSAPSQQTSGVSMSTRPTGGPLQQQPISNTTTNTTNLGQRTISHQRLPSEKQLLLAAAAQQQHHQHGLSTSAPKTQLSHRLPTAPTLPSASSSSALFCLPHQRSDSMARNFTRSATMGSGASHHPSASSTLSKSGATGGLLEGIEGGGELEHLSLADVESEDSLDEEDIRDMELQRLRQDYIKSVHRAQKAFKVSEWPDSPSVPPCSLLTYPLPSPYIHTHIHR